MEARERVWGVSFAKFSSLAKRQGWTAEYLADVFRGKIELGGLQGSRESYESYFDRILHCQPSPEVVIPYKSVIEKFLVTVCRTWPSAESLASVPAVVDLILGTANVLPGTPARSSRLMRSKSH